MGGIGAAGEIGFAVSSRGLSIIPVVSAGGVAHLVGTALEPGSSAREGAGGANFPTGLLVTLVTRLAVSCCAASSITGCSRIVLDTCATTLSGDGKQLPLRVANVCLDRALAGVEL